MRHPFCLFFSLLLAVSALAQPSPINRRAMVLSGLASTGSSDIPSSIGLTISNRWMADFSNGVSVANWVDKSNSFHWITGLQANIAPTNSSALGVRLDGQFGSMRYLHGTNFNVDTTLVNFVIFETDNNGNNPFTVRYLCGDSVSANSKDGLSNNGGSAWDYTPGGLTIPGVGPITPGAIQDIVRANGKATYTNGVNSTITFTLQNFSGSGIAIGNDGDLGSRSPLNGWIKEWIVFTNTTFTASQASNLNYYANHIPWTNAF